MNINKKTKLEELRKKINQRYNQQVVQRIRIINKEELKKKERIQRFLEFKKRKQELEKRRKEKIEKRKQHATERQNRINNKNTKIKPEVTQEVKPEVTQELKLDVKQENNSLIPNVSDKLNKSIFDPIILGSKKIVEELPKEKNVNEKKEKKPILSSQFVTQGRVSSYISYFEPFFLKTFGLKKYENRFQPCVFFGCYNDKDLDAIINNKNIKIIVWAGNDSNFKERSFPRKALLMTRRLKNVFHISISKYIYDDLKYFRIRSKQIPFCISNINYFQPIKKGKCIYYYTNIVDPDTYGAKTFLHIYTKLKHKYEFVITVCKQQMKFKKGHYARRYPFLTKATYYSNVYEAYKKCFIGLRLTSHDGNANTVQELGMCGVKCFYNGDTSLKSTLPWKNATEIVNIINKESKTIGTSDVILSNNVKEYLKPNNNWLNIKNYK